MRKEKRAKRVQMPIPSTVVQQLRERRRLKGITQQRSLEDALSFALSEAAKKIWF